VVPVTPNIVIPLMKRSYPEEVEAGIRIYDLDPVVLRKQVLSQETGFLYVDSSFFEVFSFDLIEGNASEVLKQKRSLVLTRSAAQRFFGSEDPIGQTLEVGSQGALFTITGLMEDPPVNSHLQFTMLAPFHTHKWASENEVFNNANYYSYFKFASGVSFLEMEEHLADLVLSNGGEEASQMMQFSFQPLSEVYLQSSDLESYSANIKAGDLDYIYLFSALALLILLIAVINYVNLTTARSVDRAQEVGLRKVIGAKRRQLIQQFIGETTLMALLTVGLSLAMVGLLLPAFNGLVDRELNVNSLLQDGTPWVILLGGLAVGVIAGVYPALVLSQFRPVEVLRGKYRNSRGGQWLRKGLVVFQFSISVILIAGALVMHSQLRFLSQKKLGYNKERVIFSSIGYGQDSSYQVLRTALLSDPAVQAVTSATEPLHDIGGGYRLSNPDNPGDGTLVTAMMVDHEFIPAMELELIAGDNFRLDQTLAEPEEGNYRFLINEEVLAITGLRAEEAIGQPIDLHGRAGHVQGVIKNFHFASLHQPIGPLVLFNGGSRPQVMIRMAAGPVGSNLQRIKSIWESHLPARPFDYEFLDEAYAQAYQSEAQAGSFALVFAVLAIFIAVLGLFGLAAYTIVQRTKEIGIRRV
ncbi:MAG: FtsX-like permease family protein, partial [Bacteroidota bacterium]